MGMGMGMGMSWTGLTSAGLGWAELEWAGWLDWTELGWLDRRAGEYPNKQIDGCL